MSSLTLRIQVPFWASPLKAARFTATPTCLEPSRSHVLLAVFYTRLGQRWPRSLISNLPREVSRVREDPRREGAGSLLACTQRLHPQPESALGAQDQLWLSARLLVWQNAEAQQGERQDHFHLSHGECLPNAVPAGRSGGSDYSLNLHPSLTKPEIWPTTPMPICRDREVEQCLGPPTWVCISPGPGPDSSSERGRKRALSTLQPLLGPTSIPQTFIYHLQGRGEKESQNSDHLHFSHLPAWQSCLESQSQMLPPPPLYSHLKCPMSSPGTCWEGNKSQRWPPFDVFWVEAEGVIDLGARQDRVTGWYLPGRPSLERQMCVSRGENDVSQGLPEPCALLGSPKGNGQRWWRQGVGEASPQGLATQMGCGGSRKYQWGRQHLWNRRDQSGLGPSCLIGPSFWPGTSSPNHCGHLWGWPGHLGAQCPGYSGGRCWWLGGATADSPWCTWSGRATGPGHPYGNLMTIIQETKTETLLSPSIIP